MTKDPFLLVSLEESESKALAQVMSNDTARKILDFLSKHVESATETEISKRLKLPLSTVHYNLQALLKANLVQTEEFHYSQKGKEVLHYSLANKLIIIAPKKTSAESFKDKLKALLPVGLISLGTAGIIHLVQKFNFGFWGLAGASKLAAPGAQMVAYDAAGAVADEAVNTVATRGVEEAAKAVAEGGAGVLAAEAAPTAVRMAAEMVPEAAPQALPHAAPVLAQPNTFPIALWFLAGALFALFLIAVWHFFSSRKRK